MKRRWIPFLATTAALALAAVAPAQDRGRRSGGGDGGSRSERSSPSRSRSEESRPSRSQGESRPSRDTSRPSRDESRSSPSRDQSRPSQDSTRPTRDSSNPWSRDSSRDSRPSQDNTRPSRDTTNPSRDTTRPSRDESRPSTNRPSQDNTRPSRDTNRTSPFDRTTRDRSNGDSRQGSTGSRNDRPNPFDRSNRDDRNSGSRDNRGSNDRNDNRGGDWNRDRSPSRNSGGFNRPPSQYDGRGRVEARHYGSPPSRNSLSYQVRRTDIRRGGSNFAFGAEFGGLRIGYVSYESGYRRSSFGIGFGYSHYAYDPYAFGAACVASPWYRYSYLPPYIDNTRVIVVNNYPASWNYDGWRDYDYRSDRQNEAIRDALDDLQNAFEKQDERDANRLVPQSGNVAIFNDGKYDYSLNPEDFQQMFLDGVEQSKTIRYEILDSRTRGDEVRVRARHEYEDSWGAKQSVVHTLTLRREGGDYVIREFGSE